MIPSQNMGSLPRSRLGEQSGHPAHFSQLHFLSQPFGLLLRQGLQIPAAPELVVVVSVVSVVVSVAVVVPAP